MADAAPAACLVVLAGPAAGRCGEPAACLAHPVAAAPAAAPGCGCAAVKVACAAAPVCGGATSTPTALPRAAHPAACPSSFVWPPGSGYRWFKRDTGGGREGPGGNVFAADNVRLDERGNLVLRVSRGPRPGNDSSAPAWACAEVFLDRSLGFGEYRFTLVTDPREVHPNLVASPFLYAREGNEFDVELTRWGDAGDETNVQLTLQPWDAPGAQQRFACKGPNRTFIIRWWGSGSPADVEFEALGSSGRLLHSWAGTGGNNFEPGDERVHLNLWLYTGGADPVALDLPEAFEFVVAGFAFRPLAQLLADEAAREAAPPAGCNSACAPRCANGGWLARQRARLGSSGGGSNEAAAGAQAGAQAGADARAEVEAEACAGAEAQPGAASAGCCEAASEARQEQQGRQGQQGQQGRQGQQGQQGQGQQAPGDVCPCQVPDEAHLGQQPGQPGPGQQPRGAEEQQRVAAQQTRAC